MKKKIELENEVKVVFTEYKPNKTYIVEVKNCHDSETFNDIVKRLEKEKIKAIVIYDDKAFKVYPVNNIVR